MNNPRVSHAHVEEALVAHLLRSPVVPKWNVSFIKIAHDYEINAFIEFFNHLYPTRLHLSNADKIL